MHNSKVATLPNAVGCAATTTEDALVQARKESPNGHPSMWVVATANMLGLEVDTAKRWVVATCSQTRIYRKRQQEL